MTFDHWATKISRTRSDPRGHGTYAVTTIRGRNGKHLSIIGAYISVNKGQNIGPNTVWNQQMTLMEREAMTTRKTLSPNKCPRKEAIKAIGENIQDLQKQDHAIILMIDANQTINECKTKNSIITHSIEWLRIEYDLTDPFVDIMGKRPDSTTLTSGRDIDYILTHNIEAKHITTLGMHMPAISDHQGIGIDIDISTLFNGSYSMLERPIPRTLTLNNVKAKRSFIKYVVTGATTQPMG
jgi:hypothetical protein